MNGRKEMDRNILDADTVKNPTVHCGVGLVGRDSGTCKSCRRPSATLVSGHCVECLTPCDLTDGGSCAMPDLGDDEQD
jgi:hypothetical protein